MNNEERYEISKKFLDNIKPLKDIYVLYHTNKSYCGETVFYQNTRTNDIVLINPYTNKDDIRYTFETASKYLDVTELRYIKDANVFALCSYRVSVWNEEKKPSPGILFNAAYLIFPDKTTRIYKGKSAPSLFDSPSISQLSTWERKFHLLNDTKKAWHETIQKIFPVGLFGGNNYRILNNIYVLENWIRYKEPVKKSGKTQDAIDKLLEIPLSDIKTDELLFSKEENFWDFDGTNVNVYISPVKDDMVCLRWFKLDDYSKKFFETSRLYVDKKNKYFCRKNSFGQFIAQTGKMYPNNFVAEKVIFENKDFIEGTKLEYYKNILPELPKDDMSKILWAFIYYPLTETFWKQGLKACVISFVCSWKDLRNFDDFLIKRYGDANVSEKSVNKILGINNFQISLLGKLENNNYSSHFILKNTKELLGVFDISSFTNEQSEKIMTIANYRPCADVFSLLCKNYSLKTAFSMIDKIEFLKYKKIKTPFYVAWNDSYCTRIEQVIYLYRDYLSMVDQLGVADALRPNFETLEDVKDMHDSLLEIFNAKADEIANKSFAKRIPDWKKFEYKGKDFAVVIPTKTTDLAKEGFELHHCVKSYIGRVIKGDTNIVFIRKNEELDKPFFTVEVTNDNVIEQVHGFANRNANTENGMREFVKEWANKKNLNLSNFNKIR